ncbi:cytochrome c biogenesis CcdA family protein [Brevundimonas aurifodinae]|uniref:Cytochrome c biogenesis CcdA family protein n=2 Tax=Brevundimonas TaxID=41275 RepID=A0ABV1NKR2_9CAUL|nr:MAG: cytochrome C biogenesis protein [Brevundimonas sp. 12-68-7]OYX34588.1 MAG: cytochrome C biogenesis protein [Brevundimonas subvibrioides]
MATDLNPLLAFIAGVLTILSPCVLPLVPIVLGGAQSEGRWGPVALGLGLAASFTIVGLFVATIGFSIGLDGDLFRKIGGGMLVVVGLFLLIPAAQARLSALGGPLSTWADGGMRKLDGRGPWGQLGLGALMGLVWAPCVGPTLGAASLLAAQGQDLGRVALTMLIFGIGAATPLVAIGLMSRQALARLRGRMLAAGSIGKYLLGGFMVLIGVLILIGVEKSIESWLVQASPLWLTQLTTRF